MIQIRPEQPGDAASVHKVNEIAFDRPAEANLVDILRAACPEAVSLVVAEEDRIVGHILFTPVAASAGGQQVRGMGLAPIAVLPDHQRQGVGSRLIRAGLEILHRRHCPFVIVLGHPEYYPRFGFSPASGSGLACQWEGVPDEAFMALILDKAVMAGVSGVARYRAEFDAAL